MKNHYIICGGGRVGRHLADLIIKSKMKYIILEKDEATFNYLKKHNYVVMDGDVIEESTLKKANIKDARAVVGVLPEIEKNIVLTLAAKDLNPDVKVYARAEHQELVKRLKKAGADFIVMPEVICAEKLMDEIRKEQTGNLLQRLSRKPKIKKV